jgi:MOSC domain-containing protein YiiM
LNKGRSTITSALLNANTDSLTLIVLLLQLICCIFSPPHHASDQGNMTPRVVQINISKGGVPKKPIPEGRITFSRVEGDDWADKKHHGWSDQAVCLFSVELIDELKKEGYPLFPGALGENLTTKGLDFRMMRLGSIYRVGEKAEIRITKIRTPCKTITVYGEGIIKATYDLDVKQGNVNSPKWGRSGFYAEVLTEGVVRPDDPILLL